MTNDPAAPFASPPAPPLVSVIIPAYNSASHVGAALDSMRAQTLADIEIIVIDDGSSDDTLTVARAQAAADPRVRIIARTTPSGRPSVARNDGMRAARGRYIALLDADDTSVPERLAYAVDAMQSTGARFAFTDMRRVYEDTGELTPQGMLASASFKDHASDYLARVKDHIYLCAPLFPAFLLTYIALSTSTITFERSLLAEETPWFDESIVRFEDVDLWFRFAERTRFAFIDLVQTLVLKHSRSITARDPLSTRIDGIIVRRKHLARLRPRMSRSEIRAAERNISELQFHVAYAEWCAGHRESARRWFLQSWRTRPTTPAIGGYLKTFLPRPSFLASGDPLDPAPSATGKN